jgi:hypothetical protein
MDNVKQFDFARWDNACEDGRRKPRAGTVKVVENLRPYSSARPLVERPAVRPSRESEAERNLVAALNARIEAEHGQDPQFCLYYKNCLRVNLSALTRGPSESEPAGPITLGEVAEYAEKNPSDVTLFQLRQGRVPRDALCDFVPPDEREEHTPVIRNLVHAILEETPYAKNGEVLAKVRESVPDVEHKAVAASCGEWRRRNFVRPPVVPTVTNTVRDILGRERDIPLIELVVRVRHVCPTASDEAVKRCRYDWRQRHPASFDA